MGGFEEKEYLFFFNEPNGTFFSKAYDEGESHLCTSFTSGSVSINGEVVYTEITQNDNQCLKFSYEFTGVTGTFEICEATYSTGTPGLMVKDIYAGVPIIIGKSGVEKIEEINLDEKEKSEFLHSVEAVKKLWEAASKIDPDLAKK